MGKCEFVGDVLWKNEWEWLWDGGRDGTTVKWPGQGMAVAVMADARAVGLGVQLTAIPRPGHFTVCL